MPSACRVLSAFVVSYQRPSCPTSAQRLSCPFSACLVLSATVLSDQRPAPVVSYHRLRWLITARRVRSMPRDCRVQSASVVSYQRRVGSVPNACRVLSALVVSYQRPRPKQVFSHGSGAVRSGFNHGSHADELVWDEYTPNRNHVLMILPKTFQWKFLFG